METVTVFYQIKIDALNNTVYDTLNKLNNTESATKRYLLEEKYENDEECQLVAREVNEFLIRKLEAMKVEDDTITKDYQTQMDSLKEEMTIAVSNAFITSYNAENAVTSIRKEINAMYLVLKEPKQQLYKQATRLLLFNDYYLATR